MNLIFLAVFLYGVAQALFHEQFGVETNLVWYAQTISAILIGGGVTLFNLKKYLPDLANLLPAKTVNKPVTTNTQAEQCFSPAAYEERDFDALVHLRNRCIAAKSQEGVDTCAKLAAILFQLSNTPVVEVKNEQVTP